MREFKRTVLVAPRGKLRRTADGSLRPAGEEPDIADIWAERDRIRLAQAIEEQKRKAAKKRRRKERGLLGWTRRSAAASTGTAQSQAAAKEIEIKISLPKVNLTPVRRLLKRLRPLRFSRKQWFVAAALAALVIFVVSTQGVYRRHSAAPGSVQTSAPGSEPAASRAAAPIGGTQPQFPTLLPAGKTIDQLGGWGRVSPPDKNPVFAYSDMLAGAHIVVSEQPLPDSFQNNLPHQLEQLAGQFGSSNQGLEVGGGTVAFRGSSGNDSQSIVFAKQNVLVLIRSVGKVADQQWINYLSGLR